MLVNLIGDVRRSDGKAAASSSVVEVTARLTGAGSCLLSYPITTTARLIIVPRLSLEPRETFLPWDPVTGTNHLVQHHLVGGNTGAVTWSNNNNSVATSTQVNINN